MNKKFPILIIIPHGGYIIPEELSRYAAVDKFDIFYSADSCANSIFSFDETVSATIDTSVSRLFIDVDRPHLELPLKLASGVIKTETPNGKPVFTSGIFPDEIALSNILKRYYFPFHHTIKNILETGDVDLIIECHTMMAVGAKNSVDPGSPRPVITVENCVTADGITKETCSREAAEALLNCAGTVFDDEDISVTGKVSLNKPSLAGYIMQKYGTGRIPMLRFSLSRALFFNEQYFNYDYLRVDELRIERLKNRVWEGFESFFRRYF